MRLYFSLFGTHYGGKDLIMLGINNKNLGILISSQNLIN